MHHVLITTSVPGASVHATTVAFQTEEQAITAAELINSGTDIFGGETGVDPSKEFKRHATLLFVPRPKSEHGASAERGPSIPGVDRETVNRVIDRLGQAVKSVEESKALEQVRSGFDRFLSSAEQLMRRQPAAASTPDNASDTPGSGAERSAPAAQPGHDAAVQTVAARIQYVRAGDATEDQMRRVSSSSLSGGTRLALVWVRESDLVGHEEVGTTTS